jgi:hypothetical protein
MEKKMDNGSIEEKSASHESTYFKQWNPIMNQP